MSYFLANAVDTMPNNSVADGTVPEAVENGSGPKKEKEGGGGGGGGKKEQSVLQAKLTKLAIQIGYAGKELIN